MAVRNSPGIARRVVPGFALLATLAALAALAALNALATPAGAQVGGDGFLFRAPTGSIAIRGGYAFASAGSDLFSFTTNQLTLRRGDFSTPDIAVELAIRLTPRFDLVVGSGMAGMSKRSEFRDWVDNNQQPIEQETKFKRIPVTASLRYYLAPRGRAIGQFAWLPARYAPSIGVGAGVMRYEFVQNGDFIDFETKNVFPDHFRTDGWVPMAQLFAGVDWSLGAKWSLTTEAKYVVATAEPSRDFSGFHRIDLSGFSTTAGFSVRF